MEQAQASETGSNDREYTKAEIVDFIAEINKQIVSSTKSTMHSLLAINHILRAPNARQVVDADLKQQLKDIWLKLKSSGLQLQDPPLLFGEPQVVAYNDADEDASEE
jgi:hypothetical protein